MSLIATEVCIWAKYSAVCSGGRLHHVCQSFCLWNNEFETSPAFTGHLSKKGAQCHFHFT